MNRKGDLGNTIVLVLMAVSFVIFTYTVLTSYSQLFEAESKIGVYAEAVYRVGGDAELIESYLKDSARMASDAAVEDLKRGFEEMVDCGRGSFRTNLTTSVLLGQPAVTTELECITLNTMEEHEDICLPDILHEYQSRFYPVFFNYIQNYDSVVEWQLPYSFEAYPMSRERGLSVVFTEPVTLPVMVGAAPVGSARFRPAFTLPGVSIPADDIFDDAFFESLQFFVEECAYVQGDMMEDCIIDSFGTFDLPDFTAYYGYVNGQYVFSRWMAGGPRCFAVYVPPAGQG